jgi:prevent-host-death family protein
METIPSTELIRSIGKWQDRAAQEAVTVTRNGRERFVMLPIGEYRRLKSRDREALRLEQLSDEDMAAIAEGAKAENYAFPETLEDMADR